MFEKLIFIFFAFIFCFTLVFYFNNSVRKLADIYEDAEVAVAKKQEEEREMEQQQEKMKSSRSPSYFWQKIGITDWLIIIFAIILASLIIFLSVKYI